MTAPAGEERRQRPRRAPARDAGGGERKRRRFDRAASTTLLLSVLVGLSGGTVARLLTAEPAGVPGQGAATASQPAAPTKVIVIDASGRLLAVYDDASLVPVAGGRQPAVTLDRGPARSAAATTRAS